MKQNYLFAFNMILYVENPNDSIKNLLQIIDKFSQVARYKYQHVKSSVFLYTNNKQFEK